MDGFEHGVLVADIGRACGTHTALDLGSLIGDDIAVEVRKQHYLELLSQRLLDEVGGHDVNVVILHLDTGIIFSNFMGNGSELAVGLLHDVGLGDDGHMGLAVVLCIVKGRPCDSPGTQIRGDLEVHSHTLQLHAPAAQDVFAFGIFPVEHPVNVLFGDGYGTAVGIQVQFTAHGHVGGLHGAAVGCGGGALQQNITGLDLCQNIVRDGLTAGHTVFNGQTFDILQNDGTGSDFVSQELFQHPGCLLCDHGTDAVAIDDTDGNYSLGGEVGFLRCHIGNS